MTASGRKI